MSHLGADQRSHLQSLLRERERVLRNEIRAELLESEQQQYIDLAGLVHDEADEAVAGMLADIDIAEVHRDVEDLREVEAALARLEGDAYGVCASCGSEVDYARLVAQPAARRCVACQGQREKTYVHEPTPKL